LNIDRIVTKEKVPLGVQLAGKIFDAVTDEYAENNKIIFANESERAKRHFGIVNRRIKSWSQSKRCMVPGCANRSIVRSHTVPKGMSLTSIAEAGHVLEPTFNYKTGTAGLEKIGVGRATTFPGFCSQHELLFEQFENKKSIKTEAHISLQTYRAACRELFRAQFHIEQHDWAMKEYCRTRDEGLLRILRERMKKHALLDDVEISSMEFKDDPLVEYGNTRVEPVREQVAYLQNLLLPALEKAIFQGDASGIHIKATQIDQVIPVALAGAASFVVSDNGNEKRVPLLLNVVPAAGNTLIIFAGHASESRYVDAYEDRWMGHALEILSMIESWMINGTDQWCLQPSIWYKLPEKRRSTLFSLLMGAKRNIGEECELSIFDDLRTDLVELTEAANANDTSEGYAAFIAGQKKKLT
jgi:hypothetical protein